MKSQINWQKTARVEHRLGASSKDYCFHLNTLYALMNLWSVIRNFMAEKNSLDLAQCNTQYIAQWQSQSLPENLYDQNQQLGAVTLFENSNWFNLELQQALSDQNKIKHVERIKIVAAECLKAVIVTKYANHGRYKAIQNARRQYYGKTEHTETDLAFR